MLTLLVLLLGCGRRAPNPCPFGCAADTGAPSADDPGAGDTVPEVSDECAPPEAATADPFVLVGSEKNTDDGSPWFVELLDLVWLPDEQRVLAAGQGGLIVYTVSDPARPETRGRLAVDGDEPMAYDRYYNLLPAEPGRVWATNRDFGVDVIDVTDPDEPALLHREDDLGYEGLDRHGDALYLANLGSFVGVYDASDAATIELVGQVSGLGRPWDVLVVDDHAYVADAALGLVVLSLADPWAPVVLGSTESDGMPVRLDAADGHLYMVSGAGGLEIFDLSDPSSPERLAVLDVGGSAMDVAVHDGLAGVVTQEAVALFDVGRSGTPAAPIPFSYQETEQFAMTIDAAGEHWAVGDWNILGMWSAADAAAPAIDVGVDALAFLDGAEARAVSVTNRGGAPLTVAGISAPDGVTAEISAARLAPGEEATLSLAWDGASPLDGEVVCIATDDPGRPTVELVVTSGADGEGKAIGQDAPDFSLPDMDGVTHRLSEQRGHPVLLAYFATW